MELSWDIMAHGKEPLPALSALSDKLIGRRHLDGAETMKLGEHTNTVGYHDIRKDTLGLLESGKCVFVPNRKYAELLFSVGVISMDDLQKGIAVVYPGCDNSLKDDFDDLLECLFDMRTSPYIDAYLDGEEPYKKLKYIYTGPIFDLRTKALIAGEYVVDACRRIYTEHLPADNALFNTTTSKRKRRLLPEKMFITSRDTLGIIETICNVLYIEQDGVDFSWFEDHMERQGSIERIRWCSCGMGQMCWRDDIVTDLSKHIIAAFHITIATALRMDIDFKRLSEKELTRFLQDAGIASSYETYLAGVPVEDIIA